MHGINRYYLRDWCNQATGRPIAGSINLSLFAGDTLINLDNWGVINKWRIAVNLRYNLKEGKHGISYERLEKVCDKLLMRKGQTAFFRSLAKKIARLHLCEFCYFSEDKPFKQ